MYKFVFPLRRRPLAVASDCVAGKEGAARDFIPAMRLLFPGRLILFFFPSLHQDS